MADFLFPPTLSPANNRDNVFQAMSFGSFYYPTWEALRETTKIGQVLPCLLGKDKFWGLSHPAITRTGGVARCWFENKWQGQLSLCSIKATPIICTIDVIQKHLNKWKSKNAVRDWIMPATACAICRGYFFRSILSYFISSPSVYNLILVSLEILIMTKGDLLILPLNTQCEKLRGSWWAGMELCKES